MGGMLFGIPLLFTFEVWGIGAAATPRAMFFVLIATFVLAALLVHTGGFRASMERTPVGVVREAVVAVAVGVVTAVGVLVLLREITLASPLPEALGKVVYEAAPFAIGAAVACHIFERSPDEVDGDTAGSDDRGSARDTIADVGSTLIGAVFVALNIAPTDEIPRLSASSSPLMLLAIVAVSLLVSYAIVFEAGFGDQQRRREQRGLLQHPITETVVAYLVALLAAAGMLFFFGVLQPGDPWPLMLDHVVLLGLPAAVGGAAGRLAI